MLQSYEFHMVDGNGNQHEVVGTGNTVEAAAHAVNLYAVMRWATPIRFQGARPTEREAY